jgi:hypothetical protein
VDYDTTDCEWCGEEFEEQTGNPNRFCSAECRQSAQSVEFSTDEWHLSGATGESHPTYTGYDDYYGSNWVEQRRKALERDGGECAVCGIGREEHQQEHGCDLHVHHVEPLATYDSPEDANELPNLITLCRPHHAQYEGIPLEVTND